LFFFETLFLQFPFFPQPPSSPFPLCLFSFGNEDSHRSSKCCLRFLLHQRLQPRSRFPVTEIPSFFHNLHHYQFNFQQKHTPNCKAYSFKPPPPPISNKSTFLLVKLTALAISSNLVIILDCPKNKSCSLSTLLKQPR